MAFCALSAERSNGVGLGERQPEGSLVFAFQPGLADELARKAHRAEALIVKVIGQAIAGNGLQPGHGLGGSLGVQVAHHNEEPVAPEVLGAVRDEASVRAARARSWSRAGGGRVRPGSSGTGLSRACRSLRPP